ncbi:hypothetical protein LPB136_06880 [Tenacibaculum todarodis]|uniref:Uncharacterized protein n=1 Tax=Tenacibaculum todarodis TaxID=1850252 RepID=A0A1L3JJ06_9FLAO|nr:hypothetical protein [Tenacibaculum todarodis]APG65087.1 hypothetical protein LPB136_06880 [Tenacibaculum todarodis]
MENYSVKDSGLTRNAIILLERIIVVLGRLRVDRILDLNLCRTIEHLILELEKIRILINLLPRLDWIAIQNIIDEAYSRDKSSTGANIMLRWKECKPEDERILLIHYKITKNK